LPENIVKKRKSTKKVASELTELLAILSKPANSNRILMTPLQVNEILLKEYHENLGDDDE